MSKTPRPHKGEGPEYNSTYYKKQIEAIEKEIRDLEDDERVIRGKDAFNMSMRFWYSERLEERMKATKKGRKSDADKNPPAHYKKQLKIVEREMDGLWQIEKLQRNKIVLMMHMRNTYVDFYKDKLKEEKTGGKE